MNASSSTTIGCANGSSWDYILMAGIQGYQLANVGEIMRNYSGWSAIDFARFQTMMRTIFYPINHGTLPPVQWSNYPNPLAVYANWELCCIASIIGVGVLTDNQTMFDEGIRYFQNGHGNGALAQALFYIHPGYLGHGQEADRDQNHNTLEIVLYSVIAQMAWNQGVDLYGYANNRILSVTEYTAKGNSIESGFNYYTVPFSTYSFINYSHQKEVQPTFSNISIGIIRPSWVCLYNHYVNIKGLAAPYTYKMINSIGIQGGGGDYGKVSTWYDQFGFETLTCTLDGITVGVPPSGLSAILSNGNVVLSWWGTTYATSYNLYRNNCSGAYANIANGIIDPLTYTDSNISGNTFLCYYVTAQTPSGTTNISNVANVTVDPFQLLAYLKFDETNGTVAFDSTLHGYHATLNGRATWVPGKTNNAVKLDGSTGYVSLPAGLIDILSDFTIATWVYINNQSTNARLFSFGFSPDRWMAYTPKSSNGSASFSVTLNDAGGVQSIYSPSALPIGQWVHVAVTLLGNTAIYYLNGSSVGSGMINLTPFQIVGMGTTNLPAQYWIGKSQYMGDPYLSGIVDDFRVYPGALTASQVSSLYNSSAVIGSISVLVLILVLVSISKI